MGRTCEVPHLEVVVGLGAQRLQQVKLCAGGQGERKEEVSADA